MNMHRAPALFALAALALLAAACAEPPDHLRNAAPLVTVVAVRPAPGAAELWIDLYARDLESEPVDLDIRVLAGGSDRGPATILADTASGLRGLPTLPSIPGRHHRLRWDPAGLDPAAAVALSITPTDQDGNQGLPELTPDFAPATGFPAP